MAPTIPIGATMLVYNNVESELGTRISQHFIVQEFQCKCRKCPVTFIDPDLLLRVELLRTLLEYPIYITSGYRCPEWNKECKGVQYSDHQKGKAVDIKLPIGDMAQLKMINLIELLFPYSYNGGTFMHCSIVPR